MAFANIATKNFEGSTFGGCDRSMARLYRMLDVAINFGLLQSGEPRRASALPFMKQHQRVIIIIHGKVPLLKKETRTIT